MLKPDESELGDYFKAEAEHVCAIESSSNKNFLLFLFCYEGKIVLLNDVMFVENAAI